MKNETKTCVVCCHDNLHCLLCNFPPITHTSWCWLASGGTNSNESDPEFILAIIPHCNHCSVGEKSWHNARTASLAHVDSPFIGALQTAKSAQLFRFIKHRTCPDMRRQSDHCGWKMSGTPLHVVKWGSPGGFFTIVFNWKMKLMLHMLVSLSIDIHTHSFGCWECKSIQCIHCTAMHICQKC